MMQIIFHLKITGNFRLSILLHIIFCRYNTFHFGQTEKKRGIPLG